MPTFIVQGRYTSEAIKGMVAKPEDRKTEVNKLVQAFGGTLINYYVTFGEYDFLVICEAPNEKAVASAVLLGAAGGGVTDTKTMIALSSAEAKEAFANAGKAATDFRGAGQ